jgi:anti-sigma regulatory factor (Ser/Thr protein kinase)
MAAVICPIGREVDVYVAIGRGREMATALGFDDIDRTRIEIVILELTRNLLAHAGKGDLYLDMLEENGRPGMLVMTQDRGPGIADIPLAMRDGYSTAQTLGAGLPGVRRLMDDFTIESELGVGTTVRAVKWVGKPRSTGYLGGRRS